jgi:hypothetical protein
VEDVLGPQTVCGLIFVPSQLTRTKSGCLFDDIRGKFRPDDAPDIPRRMVVRAGMNKTSPASSVTDDALDLILQRALEDIDNFLARMPVPGRTTLPGPAPRASG